ncbi:hypothetical protein MMC13_007213 [Lambiella insularis]|nr:hypothetical protein [Lambiella insularis]
MSHAAQTPQRPLPGAYVQTPAASRYQIGPSRPSFPRAASNQSLQQPQNALQQPQQPSQQQSRQIAPTPATETISPITRASRIVNATLDQESKYPELDTYLGQGISSEYDVSTEAARAPFQKIRMYPIPDKIFEQYNRAQVSTMMGLFADFNHAWVTIDNALYLWDYTHPDPNLLGFEEQPHSITAVRLVIPRPGVFVPSVTRLLVIATTASIVLVGLSSEVGPSGGRTVSMFQTRMSIPVGGMDVDVIEGSSTNGRVFFTGRSDNHVYEFTYQQEEKWFQNRCGKINHTSKGITNLAPSYFFSHKQQPERTGEMVVDDTRRLLYTLSSSSTLRVFHIKPDAALDLVITKTLNDVLNNIGHITSPTDIISKDMAIVAISPVSAQEASKIHLMMTTSTGCRLFMSATTSYGYVIRDPSNAPTSMQLQHIKFPPQAHLQYTTQATSGNDQNQQLLSRSTVGGNQGLNTSSKALIRTRTAARYPPGYFFCFVSRDQQAQTDMLFVSAPDAGRIARPQEPQSSSRFPEMGLWLNLGSRAEDIGLASRPFYASYVPTGFANELSVQFDGPASEIAILTNTGIHTMRRRRLVDMFASAIQVRGGTEGIEAEVKNFIRLYGRSETAATALAVACGQGLDVTADARVASVLDPEVLERARTAFIEFGGKPMLNENLLVDQLLPSIDMVRPSPRHDGLAMYIARLVRSIWRARLAEETVYPTGGLAVSPTVSLAKLRDIQRDLTRLQEFLTTNKSFIDGLAGPEALGRVTTKQEELALQAEHRALHGLVLLLSNIIEGIAFVLTLFDERIEEIVLSLPNETRQQLRSMTYEGLFCSPSGKELAKELVKTIVDRNIANGSNVDTVAEALRRKCGSFCSADDVVIFKAQEQLRRASESGSTSEFSRNLLNESLRLFESVSENMSMEQLQWAVEQYLPMEFYAGAIKLALSVARESDRGNSALSWIQEGRPSQVARDGRTELKDPRAIAFGNRKKCYDLIHQVIMSLDVAAKQQPEMVDGQYTMVSKRRAEAYAVIDTSEDEVFQVDLYDWYLSLGQADRLLDIQSPYIITYLTRKASEDITHANLLWRYYSQWNRPYDAATVQLGLAKSGFPLTLDKRIEYLSRSKANASTYTPGIGRQARQVLLRDVSDLLDVANIQDDVLQKLKGDSRITAERRPHILEQVDGQILTLTELYNGYADQAGYYDICILIYQAADHRNPIDIKDTWRNLLDKTQQDAVDRGTAYPYEVVADVVRTLGTRLALSETTFPIPDLVPLLERYAFEYQREVGPPTWVMDTFLDLQVPCESLFGVLEGMLYNDEAPFHGANRKIIAGDMLYVAKRWYEETARGGRIMGGAANAAGVLAALGTLMGNGLVGEQVEECRALRSRIEQVLR